jgi:hypothetical protein
MKLVTTSNNNHIALHVEPTKPKTATITRTFANSRDRSHTMAWHMLDAKNNSTDIDNPARTENRLLVKQHLLQPVVAVPVPGPVLVLGPVLHGQQRQRQQLAPFQRLPVQRLAARISKHRHTHTHTTAVCPSPTHDTLTRHSHTHLSGHLPVPSISALVAVGLYFGEKIVDLGERGAAPTAGVMAESEKKERRGKRKNHHTITCEPHCTVLVTPALLDRTYTIREKIAVLQQPQRQGQGQGRPTLVLPLSERHSQSD